MALYRALADISIGTCLVELALAMAFVGLAGISFALVFVFLILECWMLAMVWGCTDPQTPLTAI
jgi:hypothetical protein